ncbi:MAG TPA: hypothetical protein VIO33_11830, partial [Burkholderiaceae bacterium]
VSMKVTLVEKAALQSDRCIKESLKIMRKLAMRNAQVERALHESLRALAGAYDALGVPEARRYRVVPLHRNAVSQPRVAVQGDGRGGVPSAISLLTPGVQADAPVRARHHALDAANGLHRTPAVAAARPGLPG